MVGGPYNSGALVGGNPYEYQAATPETISKVKRINDLAARFDVQVKAAALQFSPAHPAAAAVIPGATRPSRIAEDVAAVEATVPAAFWEALRQERLVADNVPAPSAAGR